MSGENTLDCPFIYTVQADRALHIKPIACFTAQELFQAASSPVVQALLTCASNWLETVSIIKGGADICAWTQHLHEEHLEMFYFVHPHPVWQPLNFCVWVFSLLLCDNRLGHGPESLLVVYIVWWFWGGLAVVPVQEEKREGAHYQEEEDPHAEAGVVFDGLETEREQCNSRTKWLLPILSYYVWIFFFTINILSY